MGFLGFSSNSYITSFSSAFMMPNLEASSMGTFMTEMVQSAWAALCTSSMLR